MREVKTFLLELRHLKGHHALNFLMQINDDPYSVLPPFCCSTFSYFCTGPIILCTFTVSFYYAIHFKKSITR